LALLQVNGLISQVAHPLAECRMYYLTDKGKALAKDSSLPHRDRLKVEASARRAVLAGGP
jgi:hypothetical protein